MNPLAFILTLIAALNLNNAQVNLDDGLVAYYPFNGNANDESGNGNHGVVSGATLTVGVQNLPNHAYSFDGNDEIKVNWAPNVPSQNSPRSVCAWIYSSSSVSGNIVSYGDGLTNNARFSILLSNGAVGIIGQNNDFKYYGSVGGWSHICATHDGDISKIYINGISIASRQMYYATSSSHPIMIGTNTDNRNSEYFSGVIDEVRIYDRALSEQEVLTLALLLTPSPTTIPSNQPIYNPSIDPTLFPTSIQTLNTSPVVQEEIPVTYAIIGTRFELDIPSNTFYDADGDTLTLSAALGSGEVLPSWLSFYPDTWEFLGLPSIGDLDTLQIKVTASDGKGGEVSDVFFLVVTDQTQSPAPPPYFPSENPSIGIEGKMYKKDNRHIWMIIGAMIGGGCSFGVCLVAFFWYKDQEQKKVPQEKKGAEMHTFKTTSEESGEVKTKVYKE